MYTSPSGSEVSDDEDVVYESDFEENIKLFVGAWTDFKLTKAKDYVRALKYFWISCILSTAWSAIWYVWYLYGNLPASQDYVYALSDFAIVFSLFFYEYLRKSWLGYTAGPELYYRALYKIFRLAILFYSGIEVRDRQGKILLNNKAILLIQTAKNHVESMMYHLSLIFMPQKKGKIAKPHKDKCLSEQNSTKGFIISLAHVGNIASEMEAIGCMKTGGVNSVNGGINNLHETIENIEVSQNVNDLDYIYIHVIIVIALYFIIVVPYKIVSAVGYMIFLLYPFLIFSMMGTFLIRKYAGDPFDKHSPAKNPLHNWYEKFLDMNNSFYLIFMTKFAEAKGVHVNTFVNAKLEDEINEEIKEGQDVAIRMEEEKTGDAGEEEIEDVSSEDSDRDPISIAMESGSSKHYNTNYYLQQRSIGQSSDHMLMTTMKHTQF